MEKLLNVPLDEKTRKLLDMRADENGRASSREAAKIIKDTVTAKKPQGAKHGKV